MTGQPPLERGEALRRKLLGVEQVIAMPVPEYLVDDYLTRGSTAVLYGKPKNGKSFLALDWSLCIAHGHHWHGRPTKQGPVLYIAAEGVVGLGKRIRAWHDRYVPVDPAPFHVLPEVVRLLQDNDASAIIELAQLLQPTLTVFDTLSRCLVGGDENSAKDMSRAVEVADQVRRASGGTVLIVHHTDKQGSNYRGHSSLEGAADTMLEVRKHSRVVTLYDPAEKDDQEKPPIKFRLERVELGDTSSCVLEPAGVTANDPGSNDGSLTPNETELLALLGSTFGSTGASSSTLRGVSGLSDRTFYRALEVLVNRGLVENIGTPKRTLYRVRPPREQKELPTTAI